MSTTPETSAPTLTGPPAETAPSALAAERPGFARLVGFVGLFLLVLGAVVIIATRATGTPRLVSEGVGFLFGFFGIALMLYHASSDGEEEVRRLYGVFALGWIAFGVIASLVPGPVFDSAVTQKVIGWNMIPWGVGAGLIGLMFAVPFCRHETDEGYRNIMLYTLLGVGGLLAIGSVTWGVFKPNFLAGPGVALAVLGVGFLCAFFGQTDTSEGLGYTVAFALGVFGGAVVVYAIGRAVVPTLLYDGPAALRKPNGALDWWSVIGRLLVAVGFAVPLIISLSARAPGWLKAALGALAVAGVGVVITSLVNNPVHNPPRPSLLPDGLILTVLGLIYLAVSLGVCSDNQFVTLTRRELSAYFLSPIGYLSLVGMAAIQWIAYYFFLASLFESAVRVEGDPTASLPEPIVRNYYNLLMMFALMFQIPALTMRLLAEERRTGTLEVLLTAPVSEWPVMLSKFLATWIFFLITWLPAGLYLLALRFEVDVPFDFRPLLSFYICLAAQGLAFVGIGLFFSALTKNQIVAAVLTFVGMMFFLLCYILRETQGAVGVASVLQTAVGRLSFYHMWQDALGGRLPVRDVLLFASLGVLGVFLSVKVVETRKWS